MRRKTKISRQKRESGQREKKSLLFTTDKHKENENEKNPFFSPSASMKCLSIQEHRKQPPSLQSLLAVLSWQGWILAVLRPSDRLRKFRVEDPRAPRASARGRVMEWLRAERPAGWSRPGTSRPAPGF